jgi:hypothetical protein
MTSLSAHLFASVALSASRKHHIRQFRLADHASCIAVASPISTTRASSLPWNLPYPRITPVPILENPAGMSVECDGGYLLKHSSSFGLSLALLPPGSLHAFNHVFRVHNNSCVRPALGLSVSVCGHLVATTPVHGHLPSLTCPHHPVWCKQPCTSAFVSAVAPSKIRCFGAEAPHILILIAAATSIILDLVLCFF